MKRPRTTTDAVEQKRQQQNNAHFCRTIQVPIISTSRGHRPKNVKGFRSRRQRHVKSDVREGTSPFHAALPKQETRDPRLSQERSTKL